MKRRLALPLALFIAACGDSGGKDPVGPPRTRAVAAVSVAPQSADVPDGGSVQLTATLTDQDGQNFNTPPSGVSITWSSGDADIASVSATGLVTASHPGPVVITATAAGKSASASVTVTQVASALVAAAGNAQNVDTGAELPEPLVARMEDRHGDPVAGVEVTWAVTSGGGAVDPATGTTDAAGVVTTRWTLGSEPGEQTVRAAATGLTDVHVDFTAQSDNRAPTAAITAPADGATFTQGDDVAFEGTASDPEDGALTGGALVWMVAGAEIGTGTSFSTNTLDVGAHTVTLTATDAHGASDSAQVGITIEAAITCSDVVTLADGATMQGALPSVVVTGAVSVTGATTVCGSLLVTGDGALDLGAHAVTVADSFRVDQRGTFRMQNDAAVLQVNGDVYVGGANTTGLLTAGRIEVGGDLRVQRGSSGCCNAFPRSLDASGTHLVVLNGSGPQSVTFSHAALSGDAMRLNDLRIDNTNVVTVDRAAVLGTFDVAAAATLKGTGPVMIGGELRTTSGSTFDVARVALSGTTSVSGAFSPDTTWLDGTDQPIQGGLDYGMLIVRGTAMLAGNAQASGTTVTGNTALLDIAAHELDVSGDFRVEAAAQFRMTDAAGLLRIAGDAYFGGRTSDAISAGTIEVAGDFTQQRGQSGCCNSYPRSFAASGTHTVVLNGAAPQTVTFSHAGLSGENSRMNNLRIASGSTVTFGPAAVLGSLEVATAVTLSGAGRLAVGGALSTVAGSTVDVGWIELYGAMMVNGTFSPDSTWFGGTDQGIQGGLDYGHVYVSGTTRLDGDVQTESVRIRGTSGLLDIGAHALGVIGELRTEQTGRLRMTDGAGSVRVQHAWFGGGNSDQLTAGTMEVTGNFTQRRGSSGCCTGYDRSFRASGTHRVVLNGTAGQVVDFDHGSLTSDWSRFHLLEIRTPAGASMVGTVAVGADLEVHSALAVPMTASLDIGATLFLGPAGVLSHDGTVTAEACAFEPGSILMGPDPCGG